MRKLLRNLSITLAIFGFLKSGFAQKLDSLEMQQLFQLSLDDLMQIDIVSASGQNQKINNAPSVVSVVTAEQIKNGGYRNIAEALNCVAGLDLITDHFQPNLGIRGVNGGMRSWSRLVKVMIDGQSVSYRSSYDNFLDESLIPLEVVDRIEIIRGPNSAIYGQNAFLGVINIITKDNSSLIEPVVSQTVGEIMGNGYLKLNTVFGGSKDDFDFVFSSSFSSFELQGLQPENIPGLNIYTDQDEAKKNGSSPINIFSKITYHNKDFGDIVYDMSYQEIDNYTEFQEWGVLTHNNRINIQKMYGRLSWKKNFLDNIEASFSCAFSFGRPTTQEILDSDNNLSDWIVRDSRYNSYDILAKTTYHFDEHNNFGLGADYNSELHNHQQYFSVDNLGNRVLNPGGGDGRSDFNNVGIHMQMVFNPGYFFNISSLKGINFTAGYRFDYHNVYDNIFNYRLALVYQVNPNFSTKLMYGTSFNAPSSVQLFTNSIYPGDIVGNPDLKPEKAKTLELAFMGGIKEKLFLNLNFYYNEIDDKIEYILPYGDIGNITADNISKVYSAGLETEINYRFKNSNSYINYSYQNSINERMNPILGLIKVETSLYPHHMVKFGENYTIPKFKVRLNVEGKYITSRRSSEQNAFYYDPINYATNSYELDSYFNIDLMISTFDIRLIGDKETILSLRVNNLLDTHYYYPGFKDFDIPGLGRFFIIKLSQMF